MISFTINHWFPVRPNTVYSAWLDSEAHGAMTGGEAQCSAEVGETFTAWDEYISGTNISLVPNSKIIQNWRTVEFADDAADSVLTLTFSEENDGTRLTLEHINIPEDQPDYEQGWIDNYFVPMENYFR